MRCPNCGNRRGVERWDECREVRHCTECDTYFAESVVGGVFILDEDDLYDLHQEFHPDY